MAFPLPRARLPFAILWLAATARADITIDPAGHAATLTDAGHTISLHLEFGERCIVDQVTVLGREVIAPQTGACTAVKIGGAWHTTRSGIASPRVQRDGESLLLADIRYGPPDFPVSEEWRFTPADDHIDWSITRTYLAAGELEDTYFPGFDFAAIDTWTGGILDTGGVVWTKYLDTPVATYGSHTASVTFWNKDSQDCLRLTNSASPQAHDITARFSRHPTGVLSASFWPTDTAAEPAHGLARFLPDHQDLWRPTPILSEPARPLIITNNVSLRALPYDEVSNLGTLRGIDGHAVRELLNTIARYGIIDRGISGSNGWRSSFTCTHEPWLAEFGLALPDPNLIANYARTLDEIQRVAISPDGRVLARWHADAGDAMPGTFDPDTGYYEAQWGYLLDSQPCYVIGVAEQFDLSGDADWLRSHRDSCRAALDYMLRRDSDHDGLVEVVPRSHLEERGSDWIDIVWASYENALVNAEMFEAMERWAGLEDLIGDARQAERYREAAGKLRDAFNRPVSEGGFWNPDRRWYVYWREPDDSIHGDNLVTPVNFAAIAYGLCDDPARRDAILGQIESLMRQEGLFHWPLCFFPFEPDDVYIRQKEFPVYENGDIFLGWAELATRAYAQTDPSLAVRYVRNVIDRYKIDGLSFQRCLRANAEGSGDDILANNAMAIVGLYRDIYGIRPRHDRLFLDPHMTAELSGTRLMYPLRGTAYSIDLAMGSASATADGSSLTSPTPFGVDISGGRVRYFAGIDQPASFTLEPSGDATVDAAITAWPGVNSTTLRAWVLRSPSGSPRTVHHTVAGLPADTPFSLRRDGNLVATPRSSPEGVIEFTATGITGATSLTLEATPGP
ncbi:MAG: hypothetical protein IPJ41_15605 [Phycisphaerales bacterium]|nr:hypothetical protein [Phycisphaerales bacterium]